MGGQPLRLAGEGRGSHGVLPPTRGNCKNNSRPAGALNCIKKQTSGAPMRRRKPPHKGLPTRAPLEIKAKDRPRAPNGLRYLFPVPPSLAECTIYQETWLFLMHDKKMRVYISEELYAPTSYVRSEVFVTSPLPPSQTGPEIASSRRTQGDKENRSGNRPPQKP